jgi:ABC-type branched-subunit amino acid transport system permease subunit
MTGLVGTMLCLSLVVVTGYVGQLSVVQLALSGVAGFVVSHLATGAGIGFPIGAIIGVVAATVLGLAVGFSALRVRGVSLVVVTLAAADAIEQFGFANETWGGGQAGALVPQPHLFGINLGTNAGFRGLDGLLPSPIFGFLALIVTVALYLMVANLRRGNLGRRMLAVRSNERAAAAAGVNVRNIKLVAFTIGSMIAGVAGAMYAYDFGSISASSFDAFTALILIANVYVTGVTMVQGAVLAGFASTGAVIPLIMQKWILPANNIGIYTELLSGIFLLLQLKLFPDGITGTMWKRRRIRERERDARNLQGRPPTVPKQSVPVADEGQVAHG